MKNTEKDRLAITLEVLIEPGSQSIDPTNSARRTDALRSVRNHIKSMYGVDSEVTEVKWEIHKAPRENPSRFRLSFPDNQGIVIIDTEDNDRVILDNLSWGQAQTILDALYDQL